MTWRTIGSARESPFTRLDFRSKLMILLVATFLAFLWESPILTGGLALLIAALCLAARIRLSYLASVLRLMMPFYVILLLTHGFLNTSVGRSPIWTAPETWWLIGGKLSLTAEGLTYGFVTIFRTLTLVWVVPLVVLTTNVNSIIVGLVRMRVPYKIAFVFSATLRFVPLLFDQIQSIIEAQRLRGLALEKMSLLKRVAVYSRIAVPLIVSAMSRSQQVEVVLASKAFSGSPERTYLHESVLHRADWAVLILCAGILLAALVLRVTMGLGSFGF